MAAEKATPVPRRSPVECIIGVMESSCRDSDVTGGADRGRAALPQVVAPRKPREDRMGTHAPAS